MMAGFQHPIAGNWFSSREKGQQWCDTITQCDRRMATWAGSQVDSECRNAGAFLSGVSECLRPESRLEGCLHLPAGYRRVLTHFGGERSSSARAALAGYRRCLKAFGWEHRSQGTGHAGAWQRSCLIDERSSAICFSPPWRAAELTSSTAVLRASGSKSSALNSYLRSICS